MTRYALPMTAGLACFLGAALLPAQLGVLLQPKIFDFAGPADGVPDALVSPLTGAVLAPPMSALDAITSASMTGGVPGSGPALAYATSQAGLPSAVPLAQAPPPAPNVDAAGVREAIAAYRAGDLAGGDQAAAAANNPVAQAAVAWAALRLQRGTVGLARMTAFLDARRDWPAAETVRRMAEEALYANKAPAPLVLAFFAARQPATTLGKLALARTRIAQGRGADAGALVRQVWRDAELTPTLEGTIRKDFGDLLVKADHKFRSDRFFYKDNEAAALRAAGYAGADVLALAKVREAPSDKAIAALPPELRKDPSLAFAQMQKLRRDGKIAEAGQMMVAAPRDAATLVAPDEWWVERRMVARKLLDAGDAATAYRIVSEHSAASAEMRIEAEFHAGWIALQFLHDAPRAAGHFSTMAGLAETPISIARATYWQGRAAEAANQTEAAKAFFEAAAAQSSTYYGQLALVRSGRSAQPVRAPQTIARGEARNMAIQVIELLEALDQRDLAAPLAIDAARTLSDPAQLAALGEATARAGDARTTLSVGKIAGQRGFPLDEVAFPTFGIPAYAPLAGSAPSALVYAIARQESAFQASVVSSAGAMGLMQMIPSTARRTAQRAGLGFEPNRLISDPAFNAQLGAAHLGELMLEHPGSLILTFAAYNAGGRRVKEWIAAYGDPRDPKVDPIDWVERIPFTETRNYVQRVAENLQMYRARLGDPTLGIETTLRSQQAKL